MIEFCRKEQKAIEYTKSVRLTVSSLLAPFELLHDICESVKYQSSKQDPQQSVQSSPSSPSVSLFSLFGPFYDDGSEVVME